MERCPHCGEMSRSGAKFCTICGERITVEHPEAALISDAPIEEGGSTPPPTGTSPEAGKLAGWPDPPQDDPSVSAFTWSSPPAAASADSPAAPAAGATPSEALPSIWSADPVAGWPAPSANEDDEPAPTPGTESAESNGVSSSEPATADPPIVLEEPGEQERKSAREQAALLLDELRLTIAAITGDEPPRDLSGVIEELEIASTPPGAIEPDTLAELREAVLAARERPRDIDSMVALAARLDDLVALVFAYDRAHAAIERSLATLKGDE